MQMYLNEISTSMTLFCQKFVNESASNRPMPGPRMANDLAVALGKLHTAQLMPSDALPASPMCCMLLKSLSTRSNSCTS